VAHGTVENLDDLPAFLARIRHGRPASAELVQEVRRRYTLIGRSPLLEQTREQAARLAEHTGLPVFLGMRLWDPSVESALEQATAAGCERLCVLPLAPFSVHVYTRAAEASARAVEQRGGVAPALVAAAPWGQHRAFIAAHAVKLQQHAPPDAALLLTAHSLPTRAVAAGDPYADLVSATARAIAQRAGRDYRLAYQSQGADGGDWLGPDLRAELEALAAQGVRKVALAPFGFLTEHVETLYDLDVEAAAWARELGLELARVPALGADPGLIEALGDTVREALSGR
jgi:ferrochelatase